MKRTMVAMVMVAGVCLAAQLSGVFGRVATATTATARLYVNDTAGDWATECSVAVTGSGTVYFMTNTATNDFVLASAVPVPSGASYKFKSGTRFYSVTYATSTNTSAFTIAFE